MKGDGVKGDGVKGDGVKGDGVKGGGVKGGSCTLTAKQAVFPGLMSCICPDTAFSLTPLSIHTCPFSLQAWLMAMRASKLSTQLNTRSTGRPSPHKWAPLHRRREGMFNTLYHMSGGGDV